LREIEKKEKKNQEVSARGQNPAKESNRAKGIDPSGHSEARQNGAGGNQKPNKAQYEEKKALDKKIRKISNRIKALEHEIEQIEAELLKMDALLVNPENVTGMQVYEEYEQLKTRHDEALSSWEKHTIQLEKTAGKRN
jgi:hypothetical protein